MRKTHAKLSLRIGAICLTFVMLFVSVFPVQAKKVNELESDVSNADKELETLKKEATKLLSEVEKTVKNLEKTREELAIAKGKEQAQHDAMMLRIKYMYENGNVNMFELLLSSGCLAEFITRAEYISRISEYDKELLQTYSQNTKEIEEKKKELEESQKYLDSLQKDLDKKISAASDKLSDYKAKLKKAKEDAKKAEEAAKQPIKPVKPSTKPSGGGSVDTSYGDSVSYTEEDITLLAALLECEAGSRNYEAVLAVASVVVNRMKSRYYPNTVQGVIYQSGQFPPAHDGKVDRILARGVKPICVQAATDALNGKNNVGKCLSFRAASSGRDGTIIGDNVFF